MREEQKQKLWTIFKGFKTEALKMDHYTLAEETDIDVEIWKTFLNEPDVIDWKQSEITIIQNTELAKTLQGISGTRSVGQAQIINALQKVETRDKAKEGPIFIYSYVPADEQQKHAPNYTELDSDPFLIEEEKAAVGFVEEPEPDPVQLLLNKIDTVSINILENIPKLNASSEHEKAIYLNIITNILKETLGCS